MKQTLRNHEAERSQQHPGENVSPVTGLEAVQSVVIFVVQCSFCCPVDQGLGKKQCEDVVDPCDSCHVQRKTTGRHPANHPGPLSCAEKCLSERIRGLGGHCCQEALETRLFNSFSVLPSLQIY